MALSINNFSTLSLSDSFISSEIPQSDDMARGIGTVWQSIPDRLHRRSDFITEYVFSKITNNFFIKKQKL
jgi:hypothetical protein